MYAKYDNIYHQYTPNVSIYTLHGSYGIVIFTSKTIEFTKLCASTCRVFTAHWGTTNRMNFTLKNSSDPEIPPADTERCQGTVRQRNALCRRSLNLRSPLERIIQKKGRVRPGSAKNRSVGSTWFNECNISRVYGGYVYVYIYIIMYIYIIIYIYI